MRAVYKQMPQGLTLRRTKGREGRGNFLHFIGQSLYMQVKASEVPGDEVPGPRGQK